MKSHVNSGRDSVQNQADFWARLPMTRTRLGDSRSRLGVSVMALIRLTDMFVSSLIWAAQRCDFREITKSVKPAKATAPLPLIYSTCLFWFRGSSWVHMNALVIGLMTSYRYRTLGQARPLFGTPTFTWVDFRKPWARRTWSSCSPSTVASSHPES